MIDLAPNNPYGLTLKYPVLTAAGCFGYGVEYARRVDISAIGAIVTRSTTLRGRRVAHPPRLIETPGGLLAAGPWPDPGLARVIERYAPVWANWDTPVLLSIVGDSADEYATIAAELEGVEGIAGIELNIAAQIEHAAKITAAVRAATQLPLLTKLPLIHADVSALATAITSAGVDVLVLGAPPRGVAIDPRSGERVEGWLCGPALRPLALAALSNLVATSSVPVIGGGGIASAADAQQFLTAGAAAVQIGAALLADPDTATHIGAALASGQEISA